MQRALIFKLIFVLALIVVAVLSLMPTFQVNNLLDRESALITKLGTLSGLSKTDIDVGVTSGELEGSVRRAVSEDNRNEALRLSDDLIKLNNRIAKLQGRAIRRGLDLQGGTYLVYEIDLKQYLAENAKNKDTRLEDILAASQRDYENRGTDFFEALQDNFTSRDLKLNRYFGRRGQTDEEVVADLQKLSKDAVDRTLQAHVGPGTLAVAVVPSRESRP